MTSNCLFHLFSCPRSEYAKNNCICCSRLYVEPLIGLLNLEKLQNFFLVVSDDIKNFLKEISYNKIKSNVFFDSIEEYNAINFDQKRCLNTYVNKNFFEFIILFFETQIRLFCNFFYDINNDFYIKAENKSFFLEHCFSFVLKFVGKCIKNIKILMFQEMFSDFEFSSSYIQVINQKYIEYCDRKNVS